MTLVASVSSIDLLRALAPLIGCNVSLGYSPHLLIIGCPLLLGYINHCQILQVRLPFTYGLQPSYSGTLRLPFIVGLHPSFINHCQT